MVLSNCCGFRTILPFVVLVVGKGPDVFACFLVNEETLLLVDTYQFIAPPGIPFVFWLQVTVVAATEVQVFKREKLYFKKWKQKKIIHI